MNILLADDRSKVRFALRVLLEQQNDWKVVAEAADAEELFDCTRAHLPDLALVDADLPGLQAEWLPALRRLHPALRVVVLSEKLLVGVSDPTGLTEAFASKINPPERLLSVIRAL